MYTVSRARQVGYTLSLWMYGADNVVRAAGPDGWQLGSRGSTEVRR